MDEVFIPVSKELNDHFTLVKRLRDETLSDPDEEGKNKVSVINALTRVIGDLARIQQQLYNAQTFAILQTTIVAALREVDEEFAANVVKVLEARLEAECKTTNS
jgi:hypothetical protein